MKIFKLKLNIINLLLLVFFVLLIMILALGPSWEIGSDGFGYYSYLRSWLFDSDFNLQNELSIFDSIYGNNTVKDWQTLIGRTGNPFAVGAAILWLPFVLVAKLVVSYFVLPDAYAIAGFNKPFQIAIAMGTSFYFLLGIALLYNTLKKIITYKGAWWGILISIGVSPVAYYLIYEPSMVHGLTVFSSSLLFHISYKIYKSDKIKIVDYLLLGFSVALLFLLRWQDIIFSVIPLAIIIRKIYLEKKYKKYFLVSGLAAATFIIGISPQLFMWKYLFGSWIVVPQGASFFRLGTPYIWQFLFSSYHGMFIVHPFLIFSLIGLLVFIKKHKFFVSILFLALFLQIYINSALYDWYGGGSFGARRMVSSFFIFALGFGVFINKIGKKNYHGIFYLLIFTGIVFNALLMVAYAKGIIPLDASTSYKELYTAPIGVLKSL